jgi:hypothetical protein
MDNKLVEDGKLAAQQDTTLAGLVRNYFEKLVTKSATSRRKRREREALERSFAQFQFTMPERNWKREDLYERD